MTGAEKDVIWNKGPVSGTAEQYVAGLVYDAGDPPDDQFDVDYLQGH